MKKKTGVWEWSGSTLNCVSGCSHDCKYCYAKAMAIRMGRKTPETWKKEEVQNKVLLNNYGLRSDEKQPIMFPTSHDITPDSLGACIMVLSKTLSIGNQILIVSKPHLECIKRICKTFKKYKEQILFRFTIGSVDDEVLSFWEPGAPSFGERIAALKWAYTQGFATSISAEPILDMDHVNDLVAEVRDFVTDTIWLGKMNRVRQRLSLNKADEETILRAERLIQSQNDKNILELYNRFKDDPLIEWKDSIKEVIGVENE